MGRFAVDTATDRSAAVWVSTLLCFFYSWLVLLSRAYFKWGSFGAEDAVILGAQVVASGQAGASIYALQRGIGMVSLEPAGAQAVMEAFKTSEILYIVATALSMLSMVALVGRIFSHLEKQRATMICIVLAVISAAWGVASAMATSIGCNALNVEQCPQATQRWLAVTVAECLINGMIVVFPGWFCLQLQMGKSKKLKVILAFAFRLGCTIFSVMHFSAWQQYVQSDGEQSLSSIAIWRQAGLCYSLISATIPVSLQFIGRFATGVSVALSTTMKSQSHAYRSDRYGKLSDHGKSKTSDVAHSGDREVFRIRPDRVGNSTSVFHAPLHREGLGSQDMIIMRQESITVTST